MWGWWRKWKFNLCLSCVSPSNIHGLHYNPLFKQCLQGWRDCSPCLFNRKFAILGPTTALFTAHQSNSIWSNAPQIFSIFIQYFPISFLRDFCSQSPKHHNLKSANSSCCLKRKEKNINCDRKTAASTIAIVSGQMLNIGFSGPWTPMSWQKATIIIMLIESVTLHCRKENSQCFGTDLKGEDFFQLTFMRH